MPEGRFSQVSVSAEKLGGHSCAVRWGGTLVCWGSEDAPTPAGRFSQVSAGEGHGCALRWDGGLVCWGNNEHGQAEPPAGRFSQVSAGGEEYYYPAPRMNDYRGHSCAVRADGGLVCWGYNGDRRAEAPSGRFSQVSAGVDHSCALRVDGGVVCWGSNEQGQTEAPTGRFSQVSAGYQRSCALRSDGGVSCWGWDWSGYGLGLGESVAPAGQFSQVSAGGDQSCALRDDGAVVCWGIRSAVLNVNVAQFPLTGRIVLELRVVGQIEFGFQPRAGRGFGPLYDSSWPTLE